MTSHAYAQKWFRHNDRDNPAIAYYEDYAIAQIQESLATLTPEDIDDLKEWGISDITGLEEWRDATSPALEERRAAEGGTL